MRGRLIQFLLIFFERIRKADYIRRAMKKNTIIFLLLSTLLLFATGAAHPKTSGLSLKNSAHGSIPVLTAASTAFNYVFVLTEQPQSVNIELGQKTTFSVGAVGQGMTYQWYYRRPYGDWKKATVKGHGTASLTVTAKKKTVGTQYRCVVTDSSGKTLTSEEAVLTAFEEMAPEPGAEGLSGFYYDQLPEELQSIYAQLFTGIAAHKSEIYIETSEMNNVPYVYKAVRGDHPEFFWLDGRSKAYGTEGPGIKLVELETNIDPQGIDGQQALIDAEADRYLSMLYDGMSEYEKVLLAYQFVIDNTDYVLDAPDDQNIQSSMINHQSVCSGYAREMQYLLTRAGVFCSYIEGSIVNGEGETTALHAWNLVMIDGEYFYLDATEGDPYFVEAEEAAGLTRDADYSYMCLTSEDLLRLGFTASEEFAVPETYSQTWDFYVVNGYYHEVFDYDEIYSALIGAAESGEASVYIKYSDFDNYAAAVDAIISGGLLDEAAQYRMSLMGTEELEYVPVCNDALYTINIYW